MLARLAPIDGGIVAFAPAPGIDYHRPLHLVAEPLQRRYNQRVDLIEPAAASTRELIAGKVRESPRPHLRAP